MDEATWLACPPQVPQDFGLGATGLLQRVGQDREAGRVQVPRGEQPLLVSVLSQPLHRTGVPVEHGGVEGRQGVEGGGNDVPENGSS